MENKHKVKSSWNENENMHIIGSNMVIPIYPPKLCLRGGIKKNFKLTLDLLFSTFLKLVHVQINCIFFDNTLYIYNIYATEALQHMKHKRKYVSVI